MTAQQSPAQAPLLTLTAPSPVPPILFRFSSHISLFPSNRFRFVVASFFLEYCWCGAHRVLPFGRCWPLWHLYLSTRPFVMQWHQTAIWPWDSDRTLTAAFS